MNKIREVLNRLKIPLLLLVITALIVAVVVGSMNVGAKEKEQKELSRKEKLFREVIAEKIAIASAGHDYDQADSAVENPYSYMKVCCIDDKYRIGVGNYIQVPIEVTMWDRNLSVARKDVHVFVYVLYYDPIADIMIEDYAKTKTDYGTGMVRFGYSKNYMELPEMTQYFLLIVVGSFTDKDGRWRFVDYTKPFITTTDVYDLSE